jgi:hypothetical protein
MAVKSFITLAPDGQNSNLYINIVHFSTQDLIIHLWQLETVVFLHRCLICALLLRRCLFFTMDGEMLHILSFITIAIVGIIDDSDKINVSGARTLNQMPIPRMTKSPGRF